MITVKASKSGRVYYFKAEHRTDAHLLISILEASGYAAEIL